MNRIDERLLGLAWQVGQTQGVVEDLLVGFRTCGLADGVGMPPGALLPVGLVGARAIDPGKGVLGR